MKKLTEAKTLALGTVTIITIAVLFLLGVLNLALTSGASFLLAPVAVVMAADFMTATKRVMKDIPGDR